VRGLYYDQRHVAAQPERLRSLEEFLQRVAAGLHRAPPANRRDGIVNVTQSVMKFGNYPARERQPAGVFLLALTRASTLNCVDEMAGGLS